MIYIYVTPLRRKRMRKGPGADGCRRKRNGCGDTGLVRTDGAKDAECEDNRKEEDILRY